MSGDGETSVAQRAIRIEHRAAARQLGWAALAMLLVPIPLVMCLKALGLLDYFPHLSDFLGVEMMLSPLAGIAALVARSLRRSAPGTISIDDGVLRIVRGGRERFMPVSSIEQGWLEPRGPEIALRLRSRDVV